MDRKIVVFSKKIDAGTVKQKIIPAIPGKFLKHLPLVNAAVVFHDPLSINDLAAAPGVVDVIDDVKLHAVGGYFSDKGPGQVMPWGVDRIEADKAWGNSTGKYVKTAVVDTGIELRHPDLRVYGGVNTINSRRSYNDDNGHGTHVAGIIAALKNSVGVIGVAYTAALFSVKVLGSDGSGYLSDVIEGLEWCVKNKMQLVNMSLGTEQDIDLLHEAVKKTYEAGILIIAAAGNSGPGTGSVIYPARYPEAAAVSAMNQNNDIASFSSRGPEVDLIAPGVDIYSTYLRKSYRKLSGTSMATPHVTGTAALVIAKMGSINPGQLLNHLKETAQNLNLPPENQGAGMVDAYKAVF